VPRCHYSHFPRNGHQSWILGGRLTVLLGVCEWIIMIHLADEGLVLEVRATC
jgi:hypothetical protein